MEKVTFTRPDNSSTWRTNYKNGWSASLCDDGLQEYVDLPAGCTEFDVIFTVSPPHPRHDHYVLTRPETGSPRLVLGGEITWLGGALNLMSYMHREGHRYLRVEY